MTSLSNEPLLTQQSVSEVFENDNRDSISINDAIVALGQRYHNKATRDLKLELLRLISRQEINLNKDMRIQIPKDIP